MNKPFTLLLAVIAAVGSWFFFKNYELQGVDGLLIRPRGQEEAPRQVTLGIPPVQRSGDKIRIGSFNIQVFGESKSDKPQVMEILARIARQFDVLALQEIRSRSQDVIPRYVELINATGRQYDYVISERLGRTNSKEQYAFIFDRASIEVDRTQLYTINDPHDVLHREPFVAWFRVRGPPADQAFTFTLVNIHTDPDEVKTELNVLDDVFRAVQNDGRDEDDVIILGDFNVDEQHLGELGLLPGITSAINGLPTNTRQTASYDNLIFSKRSNVEFTGRAGVYDFMRQFNLTQESALEVSDHLPVWAEFSIYEGGLPGRVAERNSGTRY